MCVGYPGACRQRGDNSAAGLPLLVMPEPESQSMAQSARRMRAIGRMVASVRMLHARAKKGEYVVASPSLVRRCDAVMRCVLFVGWVKNVAAIGGKARQGRDGERWMGWIRGLFWKGGGSECVCPTRAEGPEAPRWPGQRTVRGSSSLRPKATKKKPPAESERPESSE